ncbi:hypothetical protein MMC34_007859 [Xylographa carneopallida]|nr:hypothetical protein [Xylographa carneopallida]
MPSPFFHSTSTSHPNSHLNTQHNPTTAPPPLHTSSPPTPYTTAPSSPTRSRSSSPASYTTAPSSPILSPSTFSTPLRTSNLSPAKPSTSTSTSTTHFVPPFILTLPLLPKNASLTHPKPNPNSTSPQEEKAATGGGAEGCLYKNRPTARWGGGRMETGAPSEIERGRG